MRLPIRVRLTAWYAVLLAAILVALSTFLVLQLRADLEDAVEREVRSGSIQIARGYAKEGAGDFRDVSSTVLPTGRSAAQVVAPGGRVLVSYGEPVGRRLVVPKESVARAARRRAPPSHGQARRRPLLGNRRPGQAPGPAARARRCRVAAPCRRIGGAGAAAPAARPARRRSPPRLPAGWWLARKALRPVEQMTSKAGQIGIDRLHERIEVPRAQDEIGHLAVTLNAMLDRLERGVEEKHRLITDASHELRTPLAAMRAELDVNLMDDALSPDAREVLESTREEVDRMSRIVGQPADACPGGRGQARAAHHARGPGPRDRGCRATRSGRWRRPRDCAWR